MSETFPELIAEIVATRPRIPEILDFSEERLKKVGIMVRPTLLNVLKFVRDNLASIPDDLLETLVKSYDTIYTTNNAYDLQTKLQLHVEGKDLTDTVVDDVVDELLAEDDEPTFTPSMDGPIIETTAEVVSVTPDGTVVREDESPEGMVEDESDVIDRHVVPDETPAPVVETPVVEDVAVAAAVQAITGVKPADEQTASTPTKVEDEKPKATRKPREKSRIEELVTELMTKYSDMEKDNKRLTKANEQLTTDNTKLKEQVDNFQAEGSVSGSLMDRLEKLVKGTT